MANNPEIDQESSSNWWIGITLAIGGTFLFALKSIFIKLAYAEGASADQLLLLRMLIAAPFYIGMLFFLHRKGKITADFHFSIALKVMGLGFLGYFLASYLDLAGLVYISAQLERLTLFTYPTMIAVLAWLFLKEKITRFMLISLVLCYAGLSLMYLQERLITPEDQVLLGVGLVLGSALSYSIYVILGKPFISRLGSRLFTSIAMLGSTFFVCVYLLGWKQIAVTGIAPSIWGYSFLLAFVSTVFPSFMISEAIARIGASRTTILGSVGPVFTIILAVFTLNEPFTWWHFLGVILVFIGVYLVGKKSKKE